MNKNIEHDIYQIDPIFFEDAIACENKLKDQEQTCMYWGLECGNGWQIPVRKLIQRISIINDIAKKYNIKFVCDQFKEKYGSLSVYYTSKIIDKDKSIDEEKNSILHEMMEEAINKAEKQCWNRCECCGKDGGYSDKNIITTHGWIQRLCRTCAQRENPSTVDLYDFQNGYDFIKFYHVCGFTYKDNYYNSIAEAFYCTIDPQHKDIYRELSDYFFKDSPYLIQKIAHSYNLKYIESEHESLLKQLINAKFLYKCNNELLYELLKTYNKTLHNTNKRHDNILGSCVCDKCENKQKKDLFSKFLMEFRNKYIEDSKK